MNLDQDGGEGVGKPDGAQGAHHGEGLVDGGGGDAGHGAQPVMRVLQAQDQRHRRVEEGEVRVPMADTHHADSRLQAPGGHDLHTSGIMGHGHDCMGVRDFGMVTGRGWGQSDAAPERAATCSRRQGTSVQGGLQSARHGDRAADESCQTCLVKAGVGVNPLPATCRVCQGDHGLAGSDGVGNVNQHDVEQLEGGDPIGPLLALAGNRKEGGSVGVQDQEDTAGGNTLSGQHCARCHERSVPTSTGKRTVAHHDVIDDVMIPPVLHAIHLVTVGEQPVG